MRIIERAIKENLMFTSSPSDDGVFPQLLAVYELWKTPLDELNRINLAIKKKIRGQKTTEEKLLLKSAVLDYIIDTRLEELDASKGSYATDTARKTVSSENNLELSAWAKFHSSGMVWFVNRVLQVFGWAIHIKVDDSNRVIGAYPAKVKCAGFSEEKDKAELGKISKYLSDNANELYEG